MPRFEFYGDVAYNQRFIRFLRVNGNPITLPPVLISKAMANTFTVSVNPRANVKMLVYKLNDGTLVYDPAATATAQNVHVLTIPANTLAVGTDYIICVNENVADTTNTGELEIRTNL